VLSDVSKCVYVLEGQVRSTTGYKIEQATNAEAFLFQKLRLQIQSARDNYYAKTSVSRQLTITGLNGVCRGNKMTTSAIFCISLDIAFATVFWSLNRRSVQTKTSSPFRLVHPTAKGQRARPGTKSDAKDQATHCTSSKHGQ
jgi:hypothetical protein